MKNSNCYFFFSCFKSYMYLFVLFKYRETKRKVDFKIGRDFNIVSNQFVKENDEKIKTLNESQNQKIFANYEKKRNFNCLVGEYYNPEREKKFQELNKKN